MKKILIIITMVLFCTTVFAQQRTVTGLVTDNNSEPLPGVTIVVKGTTIGVITGMDGRFSIGNLNESSILVFSFVGLQSQEVTVENQSTINVVLQDASFGIGGSCGHWLWIG
jgi:TonB-dependent starch-binding outer membrane protein SusC